MPDSQTAGGEIQLSCIQSHANTSHLQRLPSEAPHGHSVSLAQCKSKAINVLPALNCVRCFEHFTSPRLLCELPFQPESHPKLLSAQQLPAAPWRLGDLCPCALLTPPYCSTAAGKEKSADPGASCALQAAPHKSNQALCQQKKQADICGP